MVNESIDVQNIVLLLLSDLSFFIGRVNEL